MTEKPVRYASEEVSEGTGARMVKGLRGLKTLVHVLTGVILVVAMTSCGGDDASAPPREGGPLAISDTAETETGTVTIRSYEVLVTAQDDEVQPREGFTFAVIEVEGCVSSAPGGLVTIYANDVHLQLPDGTQLSPTRSAREPALQPITNVQAGECARGFLTYGIPDGSDPTSVVYEANPEADMAEEQDIVTLSWAIP